MPLVPETNIADVGKLISLRNLLVRKVTWLVHTTTSAILILSRDFGADCMTRIAYICSRLSRTHSFHFDPQRQHALLHCDLQRQLTLSILTSRDNTHSLSYIWLPAVNPTKMYTLCNYFFLVRLLRLDSLQHRKQPQKFRQTTERNKQPRWEKTRSS